jgi:hypothetical protein
MPNELTHEHALSGKISLPEFTPAWVEIQDTKQGDRKMGGMLSDMA